MSRFIEVASHQGRSEPKHYKTTLARSSRLMLGLNCLEPGQVQRVHTHDGQDKFYFVVQGRGTFTVGDETRTAGPGTVVWAPATEPHGVENQGDERLVLLMGMAPPPLERI